MGINHAVVDILQLGRRVHAFSLHRHGLEQEDRGRNGEHDVDFKTIMSALAGFTR
jgi:hypothetical protein